MLTPKEIRMIGEDRYWHTKAKKLFLAIVASLTWAIVCIIAAYSLNIVTKSEIYIIKPFMIAPYAAQSELKVTVENGNIYMEDFKLPNADPKKEDASIPFAVIALSPLCGTFIYFLWCTFKVSEAGDAFLAEWYKNHTEITA